MADDAKNRLLFLSWLERDVPQVHTLAAQDSYRVVALQGLDPSTVDTIGWASADTTAIATSGAWGGGGSTTSSNPAALDPSVTPAPAGMFDKFLNSLGKIAGTVLNVKSQKDWIDFNTARVKQGQPPLDPNTGQPYRPQTPASPTSQALAQAGSILSSISPFMLMAGAGFLFWALTRKR